jgi:hypothetical protein
MIRGLDLFREHFAEYRKAFVLIGGVACHEWLSTRSELNEQARTLRIDSVKLLEKGRAMCGKPAKKKEECLRQNGRLADFQ